MKDVTKPIKVQMTKHIYFKKETIDMVAPERRKRGVLLSQYNVFTSVLYSASITISKLKKLVKYFKGTYVPIPWGNHKITYL